MTFWMHIVQLYEKKQTNKHVQNVLHVILIDFASILNNSMEKNAINSDV